MPLHTAIGVLDGRMRAFLPQENLDRLDALAGDPDAQARVDERAAEADRERTRTVLSLVAEGEVDYG